MKKILITGASRGLGFALAEQFQIIDYDLYLVVRTIESKAEISKYLPLANILVCDITSDDYEELLNKWLENTSLDVVINNAGTGSNAPTLQSTKKYHLLKEFDTNCVAVLSTVKASLQSLKSSLNPTIINISSRRGSLSMQANKEAKGVGCSYSYRISKAAQNMLSLCLADELEDDGIKVATIHPGRLLTKLASSDANMTANDSAKKIVNLVESNKLTNRDYICLETGKLQW